MSLATLADIVAARAENWGATPRGEEVARYKGAGHAGRAAPASSDPATEWVGKILNYIPGEAAVLWTAIAGMIATSAPPASPTLKLGLVVAVAFIASVLTWVVGHQKQRRNHGTVSCWVSFRAGYYEILAAGIAFFAWATAMPGSWCDFGSNSVWPLVIVAFPTVLIGAFAVLLNRDGN